MHGLALENDVRSWFDLPKGACPKPTVGRKRIAQALAERGA